MHAHFVLAHPEPQSFNSNLVREGTSCLQDEGWTVTISDLYAMGFDPCERPEHYRQRLDLARFDAQAEQRHASDTRSLPKVVTDELALMDRADLLVLQYPMWWHLPPAMMKGWFDRVLAYGDAYASRRRFELGRFVGKRAMLSVTAGTSRATYEHDGRSGDIDLMLWPVNFSLAYVGYEVLTPFIAYGVEAGLRLARKHVSWYSRGLPGSAEFRGTVTRLPDAGAVIRLIHDFYDRLIDTGASGVPLCRDEPELAEAA